MLRLSVDWRRGDFHLGLECEIDGAVTAVFGPSGAGKTSLLHMLAGLLTPDGGRIELDGRILFDSADRVCVPTHRRGVAVVFQDDRLFPHYSVRRNLLYGRRGPSSPNTQLTLDSVAELLAVGELLDRRVHRLSGGERQRVALGRALLSGPRMLLLDEPVASLDAGLKRQVLPFLARVRDAAGIPILYVSHDIGEILQLTDRMLVLDRGRLLGQGRFLEVINDDAVFQLAERLGLHNVMTARVIEHRTDDGLTLLRLGDQTAPDDAPVLAGPLVDYPVGALLHVSVKPEDVALSTGPVGGLSIQNQLCGTVSRVTDHGGRTLVEVEVGGPILAELSRKAVTDLGLATGSKACCLIKAHAVRYLDGSEE